MPVYCHHKQDHAPMAAVLRCGLYLLCILTAYGAFSKKMTCSPQNIVNHLNLTRNSKKFTLCRPALDYTQPIEVHVDIALVAILSVIEKSQMFVSFLWMSVFWKNEQISWNPSDFCGITRVSLPREELWKPDIYFNEAIDYDDGPQSPYLQVSYEGKVTMEDNYKISSICRIDMQKFPFDTQSCQITVESFVYTNSELILIPISNSSRATQNSRDFMLTQGEWELLNMTVMKDNITYLEGATWDRIKYTILIRRVPLMHVLNFLLPVFFFLILDLASFFITDSEGGKLGFKVTVLLAISVLLLILNDILPAKSNSSPLIATYVICIFAFMLLGILETIFVTYLKDMDLSYEEPVSEHAQGPEELFTKQHRVYDMDEKARHVSSDTISVPASSSKESLNMMEWSKAEAIPDVQLLQQVLEHLRALRRNLPLLTPKAQTRDGYWRRVAKRIHAAFLFFYVISIIVFLILISLAWRP